MQYTTNNTLFIMHKTLASQEAIELNLDELESTKLVHYESDDVVPSSSGDESDPSSEPNNLFTSALTAAFTGFAAALIHLFPFGMPLDMYKGCCYTGKNFLKTLFGINAERFGPKAKTASIKTLKDVYRFFGNNIAVMAKHFRGYRGLGPNILSRIPYGFTLFLTAALMENYFKDGNPDKELSSTEKAIKTLVTTFAASIFICGGESIKNILQFSSKSKGISDLIRLSVLLRGFVPTLLREFIFIVAFSNGKDILNTVVDLLPKEAHQFVDALPGDDETKKIILELIGMLILGTIAGMASSPSDGVKTWEQAPTDREGSVPDSSLIQAPRADIFTPKLKRPPIAVNPNVPKEFQSYYYFKRQRAQATAEWLQGQREGIPYSLRPNEKTLGKFWKRHGRPRWQLAAGKIGRGRRRYLAFAVVAYSVAPSVIEWGQEKATQLYDSVSSTWGLFNKDLKSPQGIDIVNEHSHEPTASNSDINYSDDLDHDETTDESEQEMDFPITPSRSFKWPNLRTFKFSGLRLRSARSNHSTPVSDDDIEDAYERSSIFSDWP